MRVFIVGVTFLLMTFSLWANEQRPIRNLVVFPVNAPAEQKVYAEKSWWKSRAIFTKNQKYLVATFNFMKKKKVFQPRSELSSADAIILARFLGADALIIFYYENSKVKSIVYDGASGLELWKHTIKVNPLFSLGPQIKEATSRLSYDFLQSRPYGGHIMSINGRKGEVRVGLNHNFKKGEIVKLVKVLQTGATPVYTHGTRIVPIGEAVITDINRTFLTIDTFGAVFDPSSNYYINKVPKITKNTNSAVKTNKSDGYVWLLWVLGVIIFTFSI